MRVLITGGSGFLGSHAAVRLTARGVDTSVLDNLSPQVHGPDPESSYTFRLLKDKVRFFRGDVRNASDFARAASGATHIVHLAAETGTGQSMYEVQRYCDVNVTGTAVLLEYLLQHGKDVQQVVLASSRAVYGEGKNLCVEHGEVFPGPRSAQCMARGDFAAKCPICDRSVEPAPTDEASPAQPHSVYATTKLAQELLLQTTCSALGIRSVVLRFQNVYGPGQSLRNPYTGILAIFSTAIRAAQTIRIFEDGLESRDFVFVDDAADAIDNALAYHASHHEVFNVGSGVRHTVLQIAEELARCYSASLDCQVTGEFRRGDVRHAFADGVRALRLLGFQPRWTLADGLSRFAEWAATESSARPSADPQYAASLEELRSRGLLG